MFKVISCFAVAFVCANASGCAAETDGANFSCQTGKLQRTTETDGNIKLLKYSCIVDDGTSITEHGEIRVVDEFGHILVQGQLDHGKRTGTWRTWYANGRLSSEAEYVEDRELAAKYWNEDGTVVNPQ